MLRPSIFGENLFDDWMDFPFGRNFGKELEKEFFPVEKQLYGKNAKNMMKTDVRDMEDHYEIDIDLPGFKKEEVNAELKDGYITISAAKGLEKEEKDQETGKYIRRERYAGSMSRSFYVGEDVTQEEVHARFEDGILQLTIPKKEEKAVAQNHYIAIE
ncbi:MAG: Hsp20/alpha crystallin family protein [Bacteroides sp.]|nr:Hsp20/alpha crystallin family protein [Bacteroides sp.]MCM1549761.1 Hsp20/alpha crystallin family protein [Clostridium sp.]